MLLFHQKGGKFATIKMWIFPAANIFKSATFFFSQNAHIFENGQNSPLILKI